MTETEFDAAPSSQDQRPNTTTVIGLLVGAAAVFSYLIAYAMTNALAAADVIKPFTRDHDPRLKWFLATFCVLLMIFAGFGAMVRHISTRNLREIEQMEKEE
jgi:hypothetical protein